MATKKTENGNGTHAAHQEWKLPEGALVIDTGDERAYMHAVPGNVISGHLVRMDTYMIGDREVQAFVILTDRPCEVVQGDTEEERAKPVIAPPGVMVHVNARHGIKQLEDVLRMPFLCWVAIQFIEKKKIKGGQTVWRFRFAGKATKQPRLGQTQGLALTAGQSNQRQLPSGQEGGEDMF